ncbi:MAG: response regulator transcription factor [Sedimentisphaerales bacterium]|nr:response regulator transcription factor [Sedimentisphaerales bacterium]
MEDNGKIRILLADDHKVMRDGLKALFNNHREIEIVGETMCGESVRVAVQESGPDIINLGINMNGSESIETVRNLTNEFPDIKIIAHSMYLEKAFISEMFKAGIFAYVHKGHGFNELLNAINAAVKNEVFLCKKVAGILMNGYIQGLSSKADTEASLTDREYEILKLLANGGSSKQIALELHISTKTVDTHRRQIMNKLDVFSLPELTKYAIRCGLTSVN